MTGKLRPLHRARRFVRSLLSSAPPPEDERWAAAFLSEKEAELFSRMSAVDRRHSIAVARAVADHLDGAGSDPTGAQEDPEVRWVVAAALLHDVGKTVAGLGTYGRAVATLSGWVGGKDMAEHWADTRGFTRRVGLYLGDEKLGADLLVMAGSDPRVVAWAAQHHLGEEDWTVPAAAGRLLAAADDGNL